MLMPGAIIMNLVEIMKPKKRHMIESQNTKLGKGKGNRRSQKKKKKNPRLLIIKKSSKRAKTQSQNQITSKKRARSIKRKRIKIMDSRRKRTMMGLYK